MANPNIVNVSSILAGWRGVIPANNTPNVVLYNFPDTNQVYKINSFIITNVTDNTVATTAWMNDRADGTGISYRLAFNIYIPANSSLQLVDKGNFLYISEGSSLYVQSAVASALEYIAVYEIISAAT